MRILLWTESFWPNVGGSEVAATTLIDGLRPRGYEFVVITRLDSPDLPNTIDYQGVPVHRFACDQDVVDRVNVDRANLEEILPMRQRVAKIKRQFKPDIVHVSLPGPSLFLHRFTQGSCWDAPTLVTLHVALIPEEIRADLVTVREATERLAELEEADAAGIEDLLTPSVQESGDELGRYAEEHCDRAGSPTR